MSQTLLDSFDLIVHLHNTLIFRLAFVDRGEPIYTGYADSHLFVLTLSKPVHPDWQVLLWAFFLFSFTCVFHHQPYLHVVRPVQSQF